MAEKKEITKEPETITLTMEQLQEMMKDTIKKHEAEKAARTEKLAETEEQKRRREYNEEKVTINLFMDNDKYKDDVIVAVNGKAWQIQRGIDVQVPRYVKEVLDNSVKQDRATALRIRNMEEEYESTLK